MSGVDCRCRNNGLEGHSEVVSVFQGELDKIGRTQDHIRGESNGKVAVGLELRRHNVGDSI